MSSGWNWHLVLLQVAGESSGQSLVALLIFSLLLVKCSIRLLITEATSFTQILDHSTK